MSYLICDSGTCVAKTETQLESGLKVECGFDIDDECTSSLKLTNPFFCTVSNDEKWGVDQDHDVAQHFYEILSPWNIPREADANKYIEESLSGQYEKYLITDFCFDEEEDLDYI